MKKKIGKLKKKLKKREKNKKKRKKGKVSQKKEEESLCNSQWNVYGGTVIPPYHLEYVLIVN